MARVLFDEVQEIIDTDAGEEVIEALIDDASLWVDNYLVGHGLSDPSLKMVEKYLAAHLILLAGESGSGELIAAQRADISERYAQRNESTGASSYIRTAASFDTTGRVREAWLNGKRVRFRVGSGYNFDGVTG